MLQRLANSQGTAGRFSVANRTTKLDKKEQLSTFQMCENESVDVMLARFKELKVEAQNAGVTVDEEDELLTVLRALPLEYRTFVKLILNDSTVKSLSDLTPRLLVEESVIARCEEQSRMALAHGNQQRTLFNNGSIVGGPKKFNGKCFYCGIKGHMVKDCRKRAAYQGAAAQQRPPQPAPPPEPPLQQLLQLHLQSDAGSSTGTSASFVGATTPSGNDISIVGFPAWNSTSKKGPLDDAFGPASDSTTAAGPQTLEVAETGRGSSHRRRGRRVAGCGDTRTASKYVPTDGRGAGSIWGPWYGLPQWQQQEQQEQNRGCADVVSQLPHYWGQHAQATAAGLCASRQGSEAAAAGSTGVGSEQTSSWPTETTAARWLRVTPGASCYTTVRRPATPQYPSNAGLAPGAPAEAAGFWVEGRPRLLTSLPWSLGSPCYTTVRRPATPQVPPTATTAEPVCSPLPQANVKQS